MQRLMKGTSINNVTNKITYHQESAKRKKTDQYICSIPTFKEKMKSQK